MAVNAEAAAAPDTDVNLAMFLVFAYVYVSFWAVTHLTTWRSLGYTDDMDKKPSHIEMGKVQATAGMMAGVCSSIIATPLDTVKARLQVKDNYGVGRPSVLKTTKTLLKEDGWWGFHRGFGP